MQALCFDTFGEPSDVLQLRQAPLPEPGPGQVRVDLRLRPVNPSDLYQIRGKYGRLPGLPAVAGLEGLGVIAALGAGVSGGRVGQRVVFRDVQGTWSESLVVGTERVIPVPEAVPDAAAAQVMVNPLTAYAMVREVAPPEGAWVIVTAAGSAVARCILDLSRRMGFRVLALVRDGRRSEDLLAAGAAAVLCTGSQDWVKEARALMGMAAWGVFDAVGGAMASQVIGLLRSGGTYLVYGALSLEPLRVPGGQIIYRQWAVRGFMVSAWKLQVGEDAFRTCLAEVFDAQTQGLLCPPVDAILPLDQWREAVALAEAPGRSGKVLLG